MEILKTQTDSEQPGESKETGEANQALEFVEKHRDLFEHYARGELKIKPAPTGLDTFAFDLKENTLYVSPRFYADRGWSGEKTSFATLHEIEHLQEKLALLKEEGGDKKFLAYVESLGKSQAYSIMDNCLADVRENRSVVARTNEGFKQIEEIAYRENLFPTADFTAEPLHLQLPYALLREARLPDESCQVVPAVRERIEKLRSITSADGKVNLFDLLTNPSTPMSTRLKLQDKFVWPLVRELLEEDLKQKEQEKNKQESEGKDGSESENENVEEGGESQKESKEGDKEKSGEDKKDRKSNKAGKKSKGQDKKDGKDQKAGEAELANPDEIFKEAYERAKERLPEAMPIEETKKMLEDWQKEQGEDPVKKADEEYAKKLGVEKRDLDNYRALVKKLENVIDSETKENLIDELAGVIKRIIARRRKPQPHPRYPLAYGDDIAEPGALVAEVKAGYFEPKVWETLEMKDKTGPKFGEVEITLVCDCSGSMAGEKAKQQQLATVLFMEALKNLADELKNEEVNLSKPLIVRSEVYSFQSSPNDSIPLKKLSADLGEKERIEVAKRAGATSGSTTDFITLQAISKNLTEELAQKIKEGELKKIVIVFTDGESDNPTEAQARLADLRSKGLIVVGVGITTAGRAALTTYAPNARLAETAEQLPVILEELLKEHLADV